MRYPAFLRDGGTIGFVAPSFGCSLEPYRSSFAKTLRRFHRMGYKTVLGPNVYASDGIGISSTPENCGRELNEAYLSKESDILISCGGGELMCEVVPYIDFGAIAEADPKWYLGYSDNTNFIFLSVTLADTAAVYGPCAAAFGTRRMHPALKDTLAVLRGETSRVSSYPKWELESLKDEEHPFEPYNCTEKSCIRVFPAGSAAGADGEAGNVKVSGRLVGGCIDCLSPLVGTEFDRVREFSEKYRDDGILWFLESCDLNVFGMRRTLWNLKHAGWFEHASGFLIGRPYIYGQPAMGLDQYSAVTEVLKEFNVPIIMDVDIGHHPPMMPVVAGAMAEAVFDGKKLELGFTYR